ncbi:type II TA system antitoxin MqsA family protein [Clostridium sp. Marseille-Q7071]
MENFFCEVCKEKVVYTIRKNIIKEYKGQSVNVEENIAVCNKCGTDIFVPGIENDNLKRLYNKYRELTGLISKEEITKFREKYNLSQRELVYILGWGKMTINRYENGSFPSKSHSDILKAIIKDEEHFKSIVYEALQAKRITLKTYEKVSVSFNSSKRNLINSLIELELKHDEDILNGFRKFDIERVENLISYIASKVDNLYKTSLNKYLWFIDFKNFQESVRSITGLRYIKQRYGPVIEGKGYEQIINLLDDKFYKQEIEDENSISSKIKIISKNNYDMSIYTKSELEVIDSVINKLKNMSCDKISDESYKELNCIENDINNIISYDYADELKMKF